MVLLADENGEVAEQIIWVEKAADDREQAGVLGAAHADAAVEADDQSRDSADAQ